MERQSGGPSGDKGGIQVESDPAFTREHVPPLDAPPLPAKAFLGVQKPRGVEISPAAELPEW